MKRIADYEKHSNNLQAKNVDLEVRLKLAKTELEHKLNVHNAQNNVDKQKLQQHAQQIEDDAQTILQLKAEFAQKCLENNAKLTTVTENHNIEMSAQREELTKANETTILEFKRKIDELNTTMDELSNKLNESLSAQTTLETKIAEQNGEYNELQQRFDAASELENNKNTRVSRLFKPYTDNNKTVSGHDMKAFGYSQPASRTNSLIGTSTTLESEDMEMMIRLARVNVC